MPLANKEPLKTEYDMYIEKSVFDSILFEHLVARGCLETAKILRSNYNITSPTSESLMNRGVHGNKVRSLIMQGKILTVLEMLSSYNLPNDLLWKLNGQVVIEMVREKNPLGALHYCKDVLMGRCERKEDIDKLLTIIAYQNPYECENAALMSLERLQSLANEICKTLTCSGRNESMLERISAITIYTSDFKKQTTNGNSSSRKFVSTKNNNNSGGNSLSLSEESLQKIFPNFFECAKSN